MIKMDFCVKQGERWFDEDGEEHIVAMAGFSMYTLISLENGNRYYETLTSLEALTKQMQGDVHTTWSKK